MTAARLDLPGRVRPLTGTWKTLVSPPLSGAANMALDHALMTRARRTGERVFRVYSWSDPTLSLGRHHAAQDRIDRAAARDLGVSLVRRPTGGRALLHHHEVTYSVTAALAREDSVRAWYEAINVILLRGLRTMGVNARMADVAGRTPLPATASCFVRPDEGEITIQGRKLVGSALLRQDGALLQHGSILLEDDQPLLDALLPSGELRPTPAGTLRQALGAAPSFAQVTEALLGALETAEGLEVSPLERDSLLDAHAAGAERFFASEEWTFRY